MLKIIQKIKSKRCKHLYVPEYENHSYFDSCGVRVYVKTCRCKYCGKIKENKFIRDINYI